MKIQELRIGNKVSFKDTVVEIAGVSGIVYSFGAIDVTIFRGGKTEMHDLKTLSPIPLTEDILLKSGFELSDRDWDYWDPKEELSFCMSIFGDGLFFSAGEGITLNKYPIEYVHQLQNMFYVITGKELGVKL